MAERASEGDASSAAVAGSQYMALLLSAHSAMSDEAADELLSTGFGAVEIVQSVETMWPANEAGSSVESMKLLIELSKPASTAPSPIQLP